MGEGSHKPQAVSPGLTPLQSSPPLSGGQRLEEATSNTIAKTPREVFEVGYWGPLHPMVGITTVNIDFLGGCPGEELDWCRATVEAEGCWGQNHRITESQSGRG